MPDIDPNLEAFIHDRLRRLPPRSAPSSLAPRVLAAIQARTAPAWWQQAWWQWPLAAKAALVVLALIALAVVTGGGVLIGDFFNTYGSLIAERVASLPGRLAGVASTLQGSNLFWSERIEPLLLPALIGSLALYLVGMGCGTALVRLAFKRV